MNKYLPSKKLQYLLGSLIVLAIVFFLAFKLFSSNNSFFTSDKNTKLQTEKLTLNELIKKDSDGDGITDWEEALWGTDPKNKETFGIPDATYIKNKRAEIKANGNTDTTKNGSTETETEKFAKQFFASYAAMKTSGQDDTTINDFSSALAQKVSDPVIVDQYKEENIKISDKDDKNDKKNYYITVASLFDTYKKAGIGDELMYAGNMASAGTTEDVQSKNALLEISNAYKNFSQKLLLTPVPKSLVTYHLKMINSSNNTSIAIQNMSKMLLDPIIGISGTSQYQKQSNDFINSVKELESFLSSNGII